MTADRATWKTFENALRNVLHTDADVVLARDLINNVWESRKMTQRHIDGSAHLSVGEAHATEGEAPRSVVGGRSSSAYEILSRPQPGSGKRSRTSPHRSELYETPSKRPFVGTGATASPQNPVMSGALDAGDVFGPTGPTTSHPAPTFGGAKGSLTTPTPRKLSAEMQKMHSDFLAHRGRAPPSKTTEEAKKANVKAGKMAGSPTKVVERKITGGKTTKPKTTTAKATTSMTTRPRTTRAKTANKGGTKANTAKREVINISDSDDPISIDDDEDDG